MCVCAVLMALMWREQIPMAGRFYYTPAASVCESESRSAPCVYTYDVRCFEREGRAVELLSHTLKIRVFSGQCVCGRNGTREMAYFRTF